MPTNKEKKEELFQAVAPQRQGPILVSAPARRSAFGTIGGFCALLLVVGIGAAAYVFLNFNLSPKEGAMAQEVTGSPQQMLARHMVLPMGEQADIKQDGQGRTVFSFAKFEVVFDSEKNIIQEVRIKDAPKVAGAETGVAPVSPTSTPAFLNSTPIKIEIRNGSGVAGAAAKTKDALKGLQGYEVSVIGNAVKNNHETTLIINLTGRNIETLEKKYGAIAITALPAEESRSQADVVIITGRK